MNISRLIPLASKSQNASHNATWLGMEREGSAWLGAIGNAMKTVIAALIPRAVRVALHDQFGLRRLTL